MSGSDPLKIGGGTEGTMEVKVANQSKDMIASKAGVINKTMTNSISGAFSVQRKKHFTTDRKLSRNMKDRRQKFRYGSTARDERAREKGADVLFHFLYVALSGIIGKLVNVSAKSKLIGIGNVLWKESQCTVFSHVRNYNYVWK